MQPGAGTREDNLSYCSLGMKLAPVSPKTTYRQNRAVAAIDQRQDQTLLCARFDGSTGSHCALSQGGRGVEQISQLWFAGCDTASVRTLRTLMGLNDPDHPHLAPHLCAPELYLSSAQGLRLNSILRALTQSYSE